MISTINALFSKINTGAPHSSTIHLSKLSVFSPDQSTPHMKVKLLLASFLLGTLGLAQNSFFGGNQTPTYPALVRWYDSVQTRHKALALYTAGPSDSGVPIYVVVLNDGSDSLGSWTRSSKKTLFINNGIHAGEPDGVNACGRLTEEWIRGEWKIPRDVRIVFTLYYNVGGALNRGSFSRANQLGPVEYGFRGNAKNLDLNRDFIKMDSKNAFTFARIFHAFQPDVFVDTHVSNGADYQYTLTLIHALKERMSPALRKITYENLQPTLYKRMETQGFPLVEYVQPKEDIPEKGLVGFNDLPRYANGYASLFGALAITTETHMLKPFEQRVEATFRYLKTLIGWMHEQRQALELARREHQQWLAQQTTIPICFQRSDQADSVWFKGYQASYPISAVTGLPRLSYDRSKPFEQRVPFFGTFVATDSLHIPRYYVIEQAQTAVIERLQANRVTLQRLTRDSTLLVEADRILSYTSPERPYEGHYLHSKLRKKSDTLTLTLPAGTWLVPTQQTQRLFICHVLDPRNEDSYFAWNFFDSHLQQKEYFSDYVFEDLAVELLSENPSLAAEFEQKKKTDPAFAQRPWDMLYFIYERSPYFEPTVHRLPVYRVY